MLRKKQSTIKHWENEVSKRFWALIDEAREQGKKEAYKEMSLSSNIAFCKKCGCLFKAEHKNCKVAEITENEYKTKS